MSEKVWSFVVAFLACYGFYALFIERAWMEGEGPDVYFAARLGLVALTALAVTIFARKRSKQHRGRASLSHASQHKHE